LVHHRRSVLFFLGLVLASAALLRAETPLTVTDLGTLGGSQSYAVAVSDNGVVVGTSLLPGNAISHAFVFTEANGLIDIGTLGGISSAATAVSNNGRFTVGYSYTPGNVAFDAFVWTADDGLIDLGSMGRGASQATAVNDSGLVAGISYVPGAGTFHAFAWTETEGMVDLGLGGSTSWATAVNDNGVVVGYSYLPGDTAYHAFAWTRENGIVDLNTLGGSVSYASAVNDDGVVVGYSYLPGNLVFHAFAWRPAKGMIDLGSLGNWSFATAVSAKGVVVGTSSIFDSEGVESQHGFAWSPAHRMVDLGALNGTNSHANSVSHTGIVVGYNDTADGTWQAFAWTRLRGMMNIEPAEVGVSVAQFISRSGGFIVGVAGNDAAVWTRDTTPPVAHPVQSPPPNEFGWDASPVSVAWNWSDGRLGSGFDPARCTPTSTSSRTGRVTLVASCVDQAGNKGLASFVARVDQAAPTIHIVSPMNGGTYVLNSSRRAVYKCLDQARLSGIADCTGTSAVGARIDTSSLGTKTFTVKATDRAGNTSEVQVTYTVRRAIRAPIVKQRGPI
jgi:probable HAF family extracellular repeat protein